MDKIVADARLFQVRLAKIAPLSGASHLPATPARKPLHPKDSAVRNVDQPIVASSAKTVPQFNALLLHVTRVRKSLHLLASAVPCADPPINSIGLTETVSLPLDL